MPRADDIRRPRTALVISGGSLIISRLAAAVTGFPAARSMFFAGTYQRSSAAHRYGGVVIVMAGRRNLLVLRLHSP